MESRLLGVFQSVLGTDIAAIDDEVALDKLQGWDSAAHINLIMAIEAEFSFEFAIEEMESLTDAAAILRRLAET